MTLKEMTALVLAGKPVLAGMYHSGKIDEVPIRDKQTGNMRKGFVRREVIITDQDAIVCGGFLNDSEKPEDFRPAAKKGTRVVVLVDKVSTVSGFSLYAGKIETLTD